ncbi:hypothetical protein Tco_0091736 [Tanacetum coccineum]
MSTETNEEHQNVPREEGQRGNSISIFATTGISDLEQKTFTRSNESSSEDVVEQDGANPCSSPSSLLRLERSTSGSLKKHRDDRDNLHAAISKPMVTSRVMLHNNATGFLKSPNTLISPKIANGSTGFENGFTKPRSRGRSAMYSMARTPYARSAKAYMGSGPYKVALRQDLVLHNNTTGFLKSPNILISPKIANGSTGFENGFTTPRSQGRSAMYHMARTPYARYPSTFTQKGITSSYGREEALTSSQSAFQHEGKMALRSLEKVDSPKLLSYPHDNQKSEVQHPERLHDSRELTSKGKEKKKKRPFQMSAHEDDLFDLDDDDETRVNGRMSLLLVESNKQKTALAADIVATSTLPGVSKTPALVEPPKKKRAFQMSALEDDSFETDDADETQVNGHVSLLLVERYKQETALAADIVATSTLQGVSFAHVLRGFHRIDIYIRLTRI